jgi:hypothetical protein
MDHLIQEFDAGVILDGSSANLVESATKMLRLLEDSDTPNRCRELAEKHFSMDIGASRYLGLYSQLLKL